MKLVKQIIPPKAEGERIIRVIGNFSYVHSGGPVQDVAMDLAADNISAAAVVNDSQEVLGLVETAKLENELSKPYGRELLKRHVIDEMMYMPRSFLYNESVAVVIEHIRDDFQHEVIQYYVLIDHKHRFCGIFSSRNMLLYSAVTQQRNLQTAQIIQERIVPQYSRYSDDMADFVCSAFMQQNVGGDYYYVKQYKRHQWFFCLCDISGKGIAAAIVVAVLAGYMWNADFSKPLDKFIAGLNSLILRTFNLEKYFTGIFCTFDSSTGLITYCDMGHGLLYIVKDRKLEAIESEAANMPVGIMEDMDIRQKELILDHDNTIVIFSDGISEQENKNGIQFDIQTIAQCIEKNPQNLKKAKIEALEKFFQFKGDEVQHDDISILFCHRK